LTSTTMFMRSLTSQSGVPLAHCCGKLAHPGSEWPRNILAKNCSPLLIGTAMTLVSPLDGAA